MYVHFHVLSYPLMELLMFWYDISIHTLFFKQINYLRVATLFNFVEDAFTCELFYAETSLYFK